MLTVRRAVAIVGLVGCGVVLLSGLVTAADQPPQRTLLATMHTFFQALTTVFPLSLDAHQFQDPVYHQSIHTALTTLAQNAAELESHGKLLPPSFAFLVRSLARNTHDALHRYEHGDYQSARFIVRHVIENCFACHSRVTNPQQFDIGKRLLEDTTLAALLPRERVRLAVASRQFTTALAMCETFLQAPSTSAEAIGFVGMLEDYLKLVMRVHGDFPRAIATIEHVLIRPHLPLYLHERLTSWVAALKELQGQGTSGDALSRARTLIEKGQQRESFPAYHQGFVHLVVASSLLHRYADSQPPDDKQALAEAYYLLGVAESSLSRTSWLSETPFFLETAIRLAPASPIAAKAYDALSTSILTEYAGSADAHLPQTIQEYLEEIRRLRGGP